MSQPVAAEQVAVIVTVYNKAPYVRACIESVLRQSHAAVELVIVDDGSTDGSLEVVEAATANSGAQLIRLTNGGVSRARNLGFEACRSQPHYLLFLDGDDVLLPHALQDMVAYLRRHPGVTMCYSIPMLIDAGGAMLGIDTDQVRWAATPFGRRRLADDEADTPLEALWAHFRAMPSACLLRRSAFAQTSGWDSALCRPAAPFQAEDKDMAIQLALVGPVHRLRETTLQYRVLPTIHRDSLYLGLLAVDRKWWNASLADAARRRVHHAIRFDSRVTMLNAANQLRDVLRAGSVGKALPAVKSLLRATARWLLLPLRLRAR
jgi:glycosyltransferase involved in cell wall biosynthesis